MTVVGTCNCGSVTFELKGKLPAMYKCFCTLCQKQGGTASNAATIVRTEHFTWLSGQNKIKKWKKLTGFNSHFCIDCGSPVPNPFQNKYVWVPVGLLNPSINMNIAAYIFLNTKPQWEKLVNVEHQYQQGPENVETLISILENEADV